MSIVWNRVSISATRVPNDLIMSWTGRGKRQATSMSSRPCNFHIYLRRQEDGPLPVVFPSALFGMMQAPLMNENHRDLPPGWVAHFDHQRNMWYYVNLNTTPPQASFVHPDDQHDRTSHNPPTRPRRDTVPTGSTSQRQHLPEAIHIKPPFVAATEAYNASRPTFAQQLYASSLPPSLSTPPSSNEGCMQGLSDWNRTQNMSGPQDDPPISNAYSTPPLSPLTPVASFPLSSSASSSSASPPSSLPQWTPPKVSIGPSRRPRGARNPTFPRASSINFVLAPVNESTNNPVCSRSFPNFAPQLGYRAPPNEVTSRQYRSATVPTIFNPNASPQTCITRPKQVPNYKVIIRSPEVPPNPAKISTPAFQIFQDIPGVLPPSTYPHASPPIRPILPAISIPNSSPSPAPRRQSNGTVLPMGAAIPHIDTPKIYLLPTQSSISASQPNDIPRTIAQGSTPFGHGGMVNNFSNPSPNHELLKKVGVAVGKSAGKAALRLGTNMVLGSMGISTDVFNPNSNSGDSLMDTVTAGLSEVAVSAASHAVNAAATSVINSSLNPGVTPYPATSTQLSPEYTAILEQMEAMRWNQHITPQQTSLDASEIANIITTMQAMQIKQHQQRPPTQEPSGNIGTPYGAQTPGHMQSSSPQAPHWQQSLASSVIGGATNALVSGAMSNFNVAGTTDAAMGNFTDFTSFDPSASL